MENAKRPRTDAKRRADNKWQYKNMTVLGCKVYRDKAEKFKRYALNNGTTVNALLIEFIDSCIMNY